MLYTPKQATELTDASLSSLRNYTRDYARYFSTEATSTPRKFTVDDLRVIACIMELTKGRGLKHAEVGAMLASELETFDWTAPEPTEQAQDNVSADSGDIVPLATLRATQALLMDAKDRESAALAKLESANAELAELQNRLGKAEGELTGWKSARKRPAWVEWLFGG